MLNLNGNVPSGNFNNPIKGYQRDMSGVSDTSAAARGEPAPGRGANSSLAGLNVGDVFNGEIVDINNHNVSIKLNDDSIVNAFLKQSLEMNIGQKLVFQVKDKNDEQIFIRPMADNGVSKDLINKSLISSGLSLNARNSAIVGALINAGQPIDRQSVVGYLKLAGEYGLENIDKLIDMNKHGISINAENVEMYGKYSESAHQLQNVLDNLYEGMNEYIDNAFSGSIGGNMQEISEFAAMLDKLSQALDSEGQQGGVSEDSTIAIDMQGEKEEIKNGGQVNAEEGLEAASAKGAGTETASTKAAGSETLGTGTTITLDAAEKETVGFERVNTGGDIEGNTEGTNLRETNTKAVNTEAGNTNAANITGKAGTEAANRAQQNVELKGKALSSNSDIRNMSNISEGDKASGKETLADISRQLTALAKETLNGNPPVSENMSANLSKRLDHIKHMLKNILGEHLSLNIEDFNQNDAKLKEQIDGLYDKMSKTANIIKNTITSDRGGLLSSSGEELKNNLSFMNELNHMESYIQLPLKMSMNEANGDLYVYNKKKAKKNGDEPLTAFLHLDLEGLGATDVNVSLKNSDVSVRFTLDNEQSHKLVLEHLGELAKRLEQKGYKATVHSEYDADEEKSDNKNALLPITGNDESATSIKRYTFDLRA